ncbi:MAG: hypothetical protein AB7G11_17665, partial [Phycisphaerales bacterium]
VLNLGRPRHQAEPGANARNILGIHLKAADLLDAARQLQDEHVDIVVLDVNLQGGYWAEARLVQQVLLAEFLPHFRTIAWIDEAVGGAALALAVVPEIVFRPTGIFGPCPVSSAGTTINAPWITDSASASAANDPIVEHMRRMCAVGGHDALILRAMMLAEPMSAIPNPDGSIILTPAEQPGKTINPAGRLLTLNAGTAQRAGLSIGVADDFDAVARLLHLHNARPHTSDAATDLLFAAAQARSDESRLRELIDSIRTHLLLTDSAIEGWERNFQADAAAGELDELEFLLSRNHLYRVYFAYDARVPEGVGGLNPVWFDTIRRGLDALRRKPLPLDEVAETIEM